MSTICGIYREKFSIEDIVPKGNRMISSLAELPHDGVNIWHDEKIFLGNTIKFNTPESQYEVLPRINISANLAIAADAIIDNREDLLKEFNIPLDKIQCTPDSELILLAYLKWKHECTNYLIGDYAFAIWDKKEQTFFCARDHVGKRTLYYLYDTEQFAFSTLIKPLLTLKKNFKELNEEWIADNLATSIPLNQLSTTSTVYVGIFQLPPAHIMRVSKNGMKIQKYWYPLKTRKLKLKSNEEYEEAFRKVFFEAVRCRLRSIDSIGILLSSGLDSGSVACIAASILSKENKNLIALTSVPVKDYKDWLNPSSLADESGYIQTILSQYENIDLILSDSEGINSYNSLNRLMLMLESPYKYVQNLFWLDNLASLAKQKKCSVLLDGQFGNYSVSLGNIESYFCSMISKGKFFSAIREAKCYSIVNRRNFKSVLLHLLLLLIPDRILKLLFGKVPDFAEPQLTPIINPRFAAIWNIDRKLQKYGFGKYQKKNSTIKDINRFSAESLLMSQSAESEVKMSLTHGLIKRDPTRDKRVIEFCMSLPEEQLVQKGIDRSIIRRALKDILPDKIRLNNTVRGAQSADWIQRMKTEWPSIRDEFVETLEDSRIKKYIDTDVARSLLADIQEVPNDESYAKVQMVLSVISWKRFINKNEKYF